MEGKWPYHISGSAFLLCFLHCIMGPLILDIRPFTTLRFEIMEGSLVMLHSWMGGVLIFLFTHSHNMERHAAIHTVLVMRASISM
jgi:hypothetical protein